MAKTAKEILKSDDDFIETLTEIEEALIIERMELYANQFKPPMSVKYDKRERLNQNESGQAEERKHIEDTCQTCSGYNPQWYSDNELFNKVNGSPNGIMCPTCFIKMANEKGIEIWLTSPPLPKCMVCGGETAFIRGKYPGTAKRSVCPVCTYERLEMIQDISSVNYGIAVKEKTTKQ